MEDKEDRNEGTKARPWVRRAQPPLPVHWVLLVHLAAPGSVNPYYLWSFPLLCPLLWMILRMHCPHTYVSSGAQVYILARFAMPAAECRKGVSLNQFLAYTLLAYC